MNVWEILKWVIICGTAVFLQSTFVPVLAIGGIYPDFAVIALFFLAVRHGRLAGIWGGFFLGLLIDVYSPVILGANALAKTITGGMVGFFDRTTMTSDPIPQVMLLIFASLCHDLIYYLPRLADTGDSLALLPLYMLQSSLPRALYTAFISAILFFVMHYFQSSRGRR